MGPLALAALAVAGYTVYRRRQDPSWTPFGAVDWGSTTPTGAFGNLNLNQNPEIAQGTPGGTSNIPANGVATVSSNLGIKPATPTPITNLTANNGELWRPGYVMNTGDGGGNVMDAAAIDASLPQGDWASFATSLGIAASVVNPGIMGMLSIGSIISTGAPISIGGVLNTVSGMLGGSDYNTNAFDNAFSPGEIAAMEASESNDPSAEFGGWGGADIRDGGDSATGSDSAGDTDAGDVGGGGGDF